MSITDAQPNDVYADPDGKLWQVSGIWREPVVHAKQLTTSGTPHGPAERVGGVSGAMWSGWKRIYREEGLK